MQPFETAGGVQAMLVRHPYRISNLIKPTGTKLRWLNRWTNQPAFKMRLGQQKHWRHTQKYISEPLTKIGQSVQIGFTCK
jgi:hypothetical protein